MAKKETAKKEIVKKDELREEKMKALENALTQLNKTYGKGSVMKFSDKVADTTCRSSPPGAWIWTWRWAWEVCRAAAW